MKQKRGTKQTGDNALMSDMNIIWKDMPVETLARYLDEIREALPPLEMKDVNLEEETMLQYQTARSIQGRLLDGGEDTDVTPAQMSSIIAVVTNALKTLGGMQESMYTTERYKAMERLMIQTLNKLPEDLATEFLDEYEKIGSTMKSFK